VGERAIAETQDGKLLHGDESTSKPRAAVRHRPARILEAAMARLGRMN